MDKIAEVVHVLARAWNSFAVEGSFALAVAVVDVENMLSALVGGTVADDSGQSIDHAVLDYLAGEDNLAEDSAAAVLD